MKHILFVICILAALFPIACSSNSESGGDSSGGASFPIQLGAYTRAIGGSNAGSDYCNGVAVDSSGNIYCAGHTDGDMGEISGGGADAFVMKLNSSGQLQWLTQLGAVTKSTGGSNAGDEYCKGVAVDSAGNVYCAGYTNGDMGETSGGDTDAFVMKLNSSGQLQWLKQLGAVTKAAGGSNTGSDYCNGVAVDSAGSVYCAGYTDGDMGETNGGSRDAFALKLDGSGQLQWLTQFGATTRAMGGNNAGSNQCNGVAVDGFGDIYCAGETGGNMGEANGGNTDAFVMKLNSFGQLQWLTQLGAVTKITGGSNAGNDYCNGVAVDSSGSVYCSGHTTSAMGEANGGTIDAFVMKLNSSGQLQWLTQLGLLTEATTGNNAGMDYCNTVAVDGTGDVYCAGHTFGSMGEENGGGWDAFVMKLNSSGRLLWLTQLGRTTKKLGGNPSTADHCRGVAVDSSKNVYCAGHTAAVMGETNGGSNGTLDVFVMKLNSLGQLQ